MGSLLRGVLHFRLLVLGVAVGLLGLGVVSLRSAPVDVLPEFTPPYAEVQTEALGLSAEEVEQLITVPLEADLLNGVEGIDVIRSESVPGLSSVVMVFEQGTDVYTARQLIEERLAQAHALPNVSKPPTLLQPLSSSNRVLLIGMSSDEVSAIEQSVIARWTVRPRLMGVPGVANVAVWGLRDQQLQVQVDPARLRENGVTLAQVVESAGNAQVVSPLSFLEASTPGTGGFIETPQQRLQVRHVLEKLADPAELGKVPVVGTGGTLRLADVADITVDHQPLIGDAVVSGGAGLVMVVEKFPGADTLEVTREVESALEALKPGLTGISTDTSVFRPADYIEDALGNLGVALAVGFGLLLLVLAALRLNWRSIVVAAVAVPLSLMTAVLVLRLLGEGINALLLAGLAAALAIVVDEAVAPTQRVVQRLRERQAAGDKASAHQVVREASAEIRTPLVYASLIALLAIVPVAALGGRPGDFFSSIVIGYAVAVGAATLVAVTATPALTALLFAGRKPADRPESAAGRRIRTGYDEGLGRFAGGLRTVVVSGAVVLALGIVAVPLLGVSFVPSFQDRDVLVRLDGEPGMSNTRMTEVATDVAGRLEAVPGVAQVGAHVGRAITGDRVTNVSSSDVWVAIDPGADYDATLAAVQAAVGDVPGVSSEVVSYSTQEVREVGALLRGENPVRGDGLRVLTGVDKPLAVRVFGENPDVLSQQAERVREVMAGIDGVVDPRVDEPARQPSIEIEVDLDRARDFGVTPGDVRRAEATLLQGIQVGSVFEDQKVFDVIVQGVAETRRSVEDVRNMLIDTPGGEQVALGQVADVRVVDTPAVISRDAVSRRLDVEAGVSGRSTNDVAADIEAALADLEFPIEYHAEVITDSTSEEIGAGRVAGFAIALLVAAFLLLQAAFRSWTTAAFVLAALPVALVGAVLAVLVTGAELGVGSMLGLLAVFGLAMRGALVLVGDLQSLQPRPEESRAELVRRGAAARMGPVVTSYLALFVATLPLVALGTRPGLELLHPLAVALVGGLVTTAFTTLFLLPALYLHLAPEEQQGVPPTDEGPEAERTIHLEPTLVPGDNVPGQRPGPVVAPEGRPVR
jgi:Cu/Ag efflux pump CusA